MSNKKLQPDQYMIAIQFSEQLANTNLWIGKADELLYAAKILEDEVVQYWSEVRVEDGRVVDTPRRKNVQGQYFLLIAYALENYSKALLVHRNRESLRNKLLVNIPNYVKQHDLLQLARDIQFKLTVPEEELLSRLSQNSIWGARYPVPTGPDDITAIKRFSDGDTYFTAYFGPQDADRIRDFVERLRGYVTKKIRLTHNNSIQRTLTRH